MSAARSDSGATAQLTLGCTPIALATLGMMVSPVVSLMSGIQVPAILICPLIRVSMS